MRVTTAFADTSHGQQTISRILPMRYVHSESPMSGTGSEPDRLVLDTSVYSHLLTGHPQVINYVDAPTPSTTEPNFALSPVGRLLNANDVARRAQHRSGVEAVDGHFAGDVIEEGAQVAAPLGRR